MHYIYSMHYFYIGIVSDNATRNLDVSSFCSKVSFRTCITLCSLNAIAVLVVFITAIVLLALSGSVNIPNNSLQKTRIGQDPFKSPILISTNSSISQLNITIETEGSVEIYKSDGVPPTYHVSLPNKELEAVQESSRVAYNYNDGNEPIYLQTQSQLLYDVSVSAAIINSTECLGHLHIFDDYQHYKDFLNKEISQSLNSSDCFDFNSSLNFFWTFFITKGSPYYIAIEVAANITVSGTVTASTELYNTTVLESPSNCPGLLNSTSPSCSISTCSSFYCNEPDVFYVIKPSGSIMIALEFFHSTISGQERLTFFIVSLIVFSFALVLCIVCTFSSLLCLRK